MFEGLVASFIISPDFRKGFDFDSLVLLIHGLSGISTTVAVFRNESMQPHHLLLLILEEAHAWIQAGYTSLAPLLVRAVP